jgi:hypothetical protein
MAFAAAMMATPAHAQVHVDIGIRTPGVGARVVVGRPHVYVADRYYRPVYVPRGRYVPPPRGRYYRDVREARHDYAKDRRKAEREYRKDLHEARRDYERDIRDARRDRRY